MKLDFIGTNPNSSESIHETLNKRPLSGHEAHCAATLRLVAVLLPHFERLLEVVLVTRAERRAHLAEVLRKLPRHRHEAVRHGGRVGVDQLLVVLEVVLHDVTRHVPVERVAEQQHVCLLDRLVLNS